MQGMIGMAHFRIGHRNNQDRRSREALAVLRRFGRNEDGSLVIFALMLSLLMIMMGGIAVDVMRYETRRTSLQNTLDRSTLAAAALTQGLDPRAVVNDYFLRAGLSQYLKSVTVTEGLNFRNVSADSVADTQPLFLHMIGIPIFDAAGRSTAEQRISNVEIILVLDVSGSMQANNKMVNLQAAARSFVATVRAQDPENRISIGIVPFNGQVNLGATLLSHYNAVYPNGAANVNCVDLPASVYATQSVDQITALPMTANADTYSGTSQSTTYVAFTSTSSAGPNGANQWCPARPGNIVRLPQQDVATLQGYISGMTAVGATSINAGMKWGALPARPEIAPDVCQSDRQW